jgi:adenylyltransferase/sulfurtransferase
MAVEEIYRIDDHDRYGRFRLIPWWRQEKLAAAKVMVVGAGALGNEVLKNLALLGVGTVFLVDNDTVEATNLTRSVLYRPEDEGRPKVERAAERAAALNPDVRVRPWNGNVITSVGLGAFREMDVVIGCLDNREARLWVNRQCWKAGVPWIDGAIQTIDGVCKVFVPPHSACYECGMTDQDYRLINLKYSCPLLRREDVLEGKVPTAPTIASIVAGMQTQEALKIIHGFEVRAGTAFVYNGTANTLYATRYQRKRDCLSHESYPRAFETGFSNRSRAADVLQAVARSSDAELLLERDLLLTLECPGCGIVRDVRQPMQEVREAEGRCGGCGGVMLTNFTHAIVPGSPEAELTLAGLGVPPYDVVRVRDGERGVYVLLDRDREEVL